MKRRDFMQLAGLTMVGGSAAFVAACGDGNEATSPAASSGGGGAGGDVKILNAALDLENTAVAAYAAGIPLLVGPARRHAKLFRDQEQAHADGVAQAIKDLGGTPNRAKSEAEYGDALGIGELRGQKAVLRAALGIENMAVAAYLDAIPKLSSGELRGTAAAIVTNEAEHISVLLGALGRPEVPDAFVTGRRGGE